MPEVTVVIPAHNEEALIGRAVRSALIDETPSIEVLVVLDRCTDRTVDVLEGLGDPRVRVLPSDGPPGIAGALNTGLRSARSDLVARLDADDVQAPGRLVKQIAHLRGEALDICTGWARLIGPGGTEVIQLTPLSSVEIHAALMRSNAIVHSSVLLNRTRILSLGGYRDTRWEDYDLWVRCLQAKFRFGCIPEVVVVRNLRKDGYGERMGHGIAGRGQVLQHRLRARMATRKWWPW